MEDSMCESLYTLDNIRQIVLQVLQIKLALFVCMMLILLELMRLEVLWLLVFPVEKQQENFLIGAK